MHMCGCLCVVCGVTVWMGRGCVPCVCLWVCVPVRCDGRGSLGSASGGAVSTELIERELGRDWEETPPTFNKSSVLSLRTQPAEGTGELWRSAREVGLPAISCRHPWSSLFPGSPELGNREVFKASAATAALEKTSKDCGVCMWTSILYFLMGWVNGFLVQRELKLSWPERLEFQLFPSLGCFSSPFPLKAL